MSLVTAPVFPPDTLDVPVTADPVPMSADPVPTPTPQPIAAAPVTQPQRIDRRHHGFWASAQRQGNTVFLFFLNPLLDPENNRISGTRLLAWIVTWVNVYDVQSGHALPEIRILKVATGLTWQNVVLFIAAFGFWFGPKGMDWMVQLVKAYKGRGDDHQ